MSFKNWKFSLAFHKLLEITVISQTSISPKAIISQLSWSQQKVIMHMFANFCEAYVTERLLGLVPFVFTRNQALWAWF